MILLKMIGLGTDKHSVDFVLGTGVTRAG